MKNRLNNLSIEMLDLKKCQVDLLKLSVSIFVGIPALLGFFCVNGRNIFLIDETNIYWWHSSIVLLLLLSAIPLMFPYIAWIIIHKSRSLFRITSYFIFIESIGNIEDESLQYETIYREVLNDSWLNCRFTNSRRKNYFNRWRSYSYWKNIYISHCCLPDNFFELWEKDHSSSYTGGFYERIIRMLGHMISIYILIIFIYSYVIITIILNSSSISNFLIIPYALFLLSISAYSIYNARLNDRYIKELSVIPFSKDAQYELWCRAYERVKFPNKIIPPGRKSCCEH